MVEYFRIFAIGILMNAVMESKAIMNQQICELLRAHDPKGMKLLFDSRYKSLVSWANTFLDCLEDAEDLVQEFFIDIWNGTLHEELRPETLDSFLRVLVRNRAYNQLKKKDVLSNHVGLGKVEAIFQEYDDTKDRLIAEVFEEIEKLPERTRQVLRGVFADGARYQEVADRLGVSVSTVKTLLGNGIQSLRERLDNDRVAQFLLVVTSSLPHFHAGEQ